MPHLKAAAYYSPRREGFNQLARYYQAEALYRDGKYAEARDILTDLYNLSALQNRPEGQLISYQTAYTYFKEADYEKALKWFQNYLEGDARLGADAQPAWETATSSAAITLRPWLPMSARWQNIPIRATCIRVTGPAWPAACSGTTPARRISWKTPSRPDPAAPYYGESLYELGRAYVALRTTMTPSATFRTLRSATSGPGPRCPPCWSWA